MRIFIFYQKQRFESKNYLPNSLQMYLVSNLTFQIPNKEKYMTIVSHGKHISGHLYSYGCIFPPIYIPLNNSEKK